MLLQRGTCCALHSPGPDDVLGCPKLSCEAALCGCAHATDHAPLMRVALLIWLIVIMTAVTVSPVQEKGGGIQEIMLINVEAEKWVEGDGIE